VHAQQRKWTHPSIKALAGSGDPVAEITKRARRVITEAAEQGLTGPPFDPLLLADSLKIPVIPREDVRDARTIAAGGRPVIEFNPNRSRGRVRYSICHELAHTLFPDCLDRVRNRLAHQNMTKDDWQLEMLCNIGAAELLMPIGSFQQLKEESVSIDHLIDLRSKFETSTEALFLRVINLTDAPRAVFCASRRADGTEDRYQIDYVVPSKTWTLSIPRGFVLPRQSVVEECTAIGFTAKGEEQWNPILGSLVVECIGIPPYPKEVHPRVIGLLHPKKPVDDRSEKITYIKGDATQPRGDGMKLIAHVVNDRTSRWGGGFAFVIRNTWPFVQEEFKQWAGEDPSRLRLGNTHLTPVTEDISILNMICQHGYGPSPKPRIRYGSLESCLDQLADIADNRGASIHMPRIGCGQAGGSWAIVSEMIEWIVCRRSLKVTIYDLPGKELRQEIQPLFSYLKQDS
jgi:O-acetyl-ADP-ribose deacetylase (regulator of RNase III)